MICVSLTEKNLSAALKAAETLLSEADLFEIRLDALEEPQIQPFLTAIPKPLLFTFRAPDEGGLKEDPLSFRLKFLLQAARAKAFAVDLELSAGEEAIFALRKTAQESRLILSFHDFSGTPPLERLKEIARKQKSLGADWGKIVTQAQSPEEALKILRLIPWARKELGLPLIAFAMGPYGKFSRAVCLLLGSPLTYASPSESKAAAPGQIPAPLLRQAIKILSP